MKNWIRLIALVAMFSMLVSPEVLAGKPGSGKKKQCFFQKIGESIKKATQKAAKAIKKAAHKAQLAVKNAAKKAKMAVKKTGAKINNAVKDTYVNIKQKITGKKNKVWVCGHYDKNGKWIKGHWRYLPKKPTNGGNNSPSQGNYPGQSQDPLPPVEGEPGQGGDDSWTPGDDWSTPADGASDGQSGDAAAEEGAPVDEAPVDEAPDASTDGSSEASPEDPVLPELPGDAEEIPGDEAPVDEAPVDEAPVDEAPVDEAPVDDGIPSDDAAQGSQSEQSEQSEQAGQAAQDGESDDAAQAGQTEQKEISLRTMGMLMGDIVRQSDEITNFRRSAKPGMSFSLGTTECINSTYVGREVNSKLLVRVIVWDLHQNNGQSGVYFNFFLHKMKTYKGTDRRLIKDVIDKVKAGVKYGAGQADEAYKGQYGKRLAELENF